MASRTQILSYSNFFRNQSEIWKSLSYQQWDSIYNKLRLIQLQGLECAPVGKSFIPNKYPVILKPIISMISKQQKYRVCLNELDYQQLVESGQFAGWFWMPYLDNQNQKCIELIVHNGRPIFGYYLDYNTNQEIDGAIAKIQLNIPTTRTLVFGTIPGWEQVLAPFLKGYTGALNIYYIGAYIISASAKWTIWSEYIWQNHKLHRVLEQICKILNTYSPSINQPENTITNITSVCLDLFTQGLNDEIINLIPLYLKSHNDFVLAKKHWQTICNSLNLPIYWTSVAESRVDEFMPMIATIITFSTEQLRKINKYKQISQLESTGQNIPIVY